MASTTQIYILTVFVGQESGYRLVGSHRLPSVPGGAVVLIWSSGPSLKLMGQLVGRIHFLDVVGLGSAPGGHPSPWAAHTMLLLSSLGWQENLPVAFKALT